MLTRTRLALPDSIALRIWVAQDRMLHAWRRACAGTGITPAAQAALAIIRDNPGLSQRALAEALTVSPPNVTAMIVGLERAGLVSRTVDSGDVRVFALTLTAAGERRLEEVQERLAALEQRFLCRLDDHERRALRALIDRLAVPEA